MGDKDLIPTLDSSEAYEAWIIQFKWAMKRLLHNVKKDEHNGTVIASLYAAARKNSVMKKILLIAAPNPDAPPDLKDVFEALEVHYRPHAGGIKQEGNCITLLTRR
eukprot:GHVR01088751.1.p1 GENE.GHVR01088751.1~~GHVR01088751.1.p1  ORF type:complete len:106 (+),score=8.64 GHVR01088751.1:276-593(+)